MTSTSIREPLWEMADVMRFFNCSRSTAYEIRGLQSCRVKVPGMKRVARFDPAKVRALTEPKRRSA